jgi:hypothetical protein
MKRQRLNRLSHVERVELNRQVKEAVEANSIQPSYIVFDSPIFLCVKIMARFARAFTTVGLAKLGVKMLTHFCA